MLILQLSKSFLCIFTALCVFNLMSSVLVLYQQNNNIQNNKSFFSFKVCGPIELHGQHIRDEAVSWLNYK